MISMEARIWPRACIVPARAEGIVPDTGYMHRNPDPNGRCCRPGTDERAEGMLRQPAASSPTGVSGGVPRACCQFCYGVTLSVSGLSVSVRRRVAKCR